MARSGRCAPADPGRPSGPVGLTLEAALDPQRALAERLEERRRQREGEPEEPAQEELPLDGDDAA